MALSSVLGRDEVGKFVLGTRISEIYTKTITETVTISESLDRLQNVFKNINESMSINDSLSRVLISNKTISEIISISDTIQKRLIYSRSMSESVSISDGLARIQIMIRELIETIEVTDLIDRVYILQMLKKGYADITNPTGSARITKPRLYVKSTKSINTAFHP